MTALIRWIGYAAVGVLVAASATMNYLFASSLGRSFVEAQVLGVVSVAIDALKAVLVVSIASALRHNRRTFALIAGTVFAIFTLASLFAAMGFVASNRTSISGAGDTLALQLADAEGEIAKVKKQLASLPDSRPKSIVSEAIRAARDDALWSASRSCRLATNAAQQSHCATLRRLNVELVAREEAERLDLQLRALQARAVELRDKGAAIGGDPQARWIAGIAGADEGTVQRLLMALLALVVEIASGFGGYLVTGHEPPRDLSPENVTPVTVDLASHKVSAGGAVIVPVAQAANTARSRSDRRASTTKSTQLATPSPE